MLGPDKNVSPVSVTSAYDDPQAALETVLNRPGYPILADMTTSEEYKSAGLLPFFREYWAIDGDLLVPEAEHVYQNARFFEAARDLFGLSDIRPYFLAVNLAAAMPAGAIHVDVPIFRGLRRGEIPPRVLMAMGASGLFDHWHLRQAGCVSWFYPGKDGAFEYWPNGLDKPSASVCGPFWNVAIAADNDLMHHRIGRIGDPAKAPQYDLDRNSCLRWTAQEWQIVNDGVAVQALRPESVRVSILWKANVFTPESADLFDSGEDNLTPSRAIGILADDMKARGVPNYRPSNESWSDDEWNNLVIDEYPTAARLASSRKSQV